MRDPILITESRDENIDWTSEELVSLVFWQWILENDMLFDDSPLNAYTS